MMKVSIWQLADDPASYGKHAGNFIVVTPDGEDEPYWDSEEASGFKTENDARRFAEARGDEVVCRVGRCAA